MGAHQQSSFKYQRDWIQSYDDYQFGWTEAMATFIASLMAATNSGLRGQDLTAFCDRHAPDIRLIQPTHQITEASPFRHDWLWVWM
jgi:hypothetical protein